MIKDLFSKLRQFSLAALIIVELVPVSTSQAPSPTYFRELRIDSDLHIIVTNGIYLSRSQEPSTGPYYEPFYGAFVTSVDHWESKPEAKFPERALYLETGKDGVLDRTVKSDEILSGPFGSLNAERVCYYTRPIDKGFSSVSIEFNGNDRSHETPRKVSGPPDSSSALTSLSLVRIFRIGSDYVIVSANYEADGRLGSLNFAAAKDGRPSPNGLSGTAMYRTSDPVVDGIQREHLATDLTKYNIPTEIAVDTYLRSHALSLPTASLAQERNVMHEFYEFGKFIRQNELRDGVIVASHWLQPSETQEERSGLNTLCNARFRKQQAAGLPTVE